MKKVILSAIAVAAIALNSYAQSPDSFKYQAVIRDASQNVVANQAVGMQITIMQGSATGTVVYQETFALTSNAYGLVNLEIGTGTVVTGSISAIDWSNGPFFIETAIDATGGTNYTVMGTSQLLSVPYALYSKTAGSVMNDMVNDADSVVGNEYNTSVNLNGTTLEITDGGGTLTTDLSTLQDGVNDADADSTNELQTLSVSGNTLSISNGNTITLPADNDWNTNGNDIYSANSGNVGIGTNGPGEKLAIVAPDATIDIFNSNDGGVGSFAGNTFHSMQLGMRNGSSVTSGVLAPGQKRSFFALDNNGVVGSVTNDYGNPVFRNVLDDGNGNMGIGTATPTAKLNVVGPLNTSADPNLWTPTMVIDNASGSQQLPIELKVGGTTRAAFRVDMWGNLVLSATGTGGVYVGGGSGSVIFDNNGFYDGATGNLGLGTTTPAEKLDVQGNITLTGEIIQNPWQNITLQNGWSNYGGGYATAQYYKDKEGVIHVKGLITGGTTAQGTVVFTLPAGYRPTERRIMSALTYSTTEGQVLRMDVLTNGDVIIFGTVASPFWINMEFSFRP